MPCDGAWCNSTSEQKGPGETVTDLGYALQHLAALARGLTTERGVREVEMFTARCEET